MAKASNSEVLVLTCLSFQGFKIPDHVYRGPQPSVLLVVYVRLAFFRFDIMKISEICCGRYEAYKPFLWFTQIMTRDFAWG
jgi:hypothetical protein